MRDCPVAPNLKLNFKLGGPVLAAGITDHKDRQPNITSNACNAAFLSCVFKQEKIMLDSEVMATYTLFYLLVKTVKTLWQPGKHLTDML